MRILKRFKSSLMAALVGLTIQPGLVAATEVGPVVGDGQVVGAPESTSIPIMNGEDSVIIDPATGEVALSDIDAYLLFYIGMDDDGVRDAGGDGFEDIFTDEEVRMMVAEEEAAKVASLVPQPVQPPKDAPNVVLILLDDAGFGEFSTFGGGIPSPTMDKLAAEGLRYNRFHTTSLCSPTRAALITGRNHHSAAFAGITELATGYEGYTTILPRSTGTVGEVLRQNGYMTAWIGKNHNTPTWETSAGRAWIGRDRRGSSLHRPG